MPAPALHLTTIVTSGIHPERSDLASDAMGFAPTTKPGGGSIAYAFYNRIGRFAYRKGVDPARVLGCVMAHEMGHLLLGFGAHTTDGIMRGQWEAWELGRLKVGLLTFTTNDARAIQKKLSAPNRQP